MPKSFATAVFEDLDCALIDVTNVSDNIMVVGCAERPAVSSMTRAAGGRAIILLKRIGKSCLQGEFKLN